MYHQGKQFRKSLEDKSIEIKEAAKKLGVVRQTLYNYFDKEVLDDEFVQSVQESFGIYLTRKGKGIPYYDISATGGKVDIFQNEDPEFIKGYIVVPDFLGCDVALNVSGNSMEPRYCNGDIIACKRIHDKSVIPFGEAFLIVTKEHRLLKYIRKGKTANKVLLVSHNKEYEDYEISLDQILYLFIIKGKITRNII